MRKGKFFLWSITLIMCMLSGTGILYAQNGPKVTVKMQNATVRDVLKSIEENTDFAFFYNNADFDSTAVVSVNADNQSVEKVIAGILPGFTCKIENKKIILVKNHAPAAGAQQTKKGDDAYEITGTIHDSTGEPLIGASAVVVHNGKSCGGIADLDGRFTITLPSAPSPDEKIVFSYIGYVDEVLPLGNMARFEITLKDDTELLSESVVVGYGTQKKVNLTGAVAAVSSDELKDRPVASVGQALQGVIPNLNITQSSGRPGAGSNYNIRGITSPNGGSPLILVDGVETYLERINSNDIESISVLMDASSAAIYGARGASGVILVTTKSGKADTAPKVTADARFSVSANTASTDFETRGYYHARIVDMFNMARTGVTYSNYTDEDYQRLYERRNDVVENPDRPWVVTEMRDGKQAYVYLANFDWYNWMFDESRPTQDYNVNISGGGKNVTYLVSGRYYGQEGIFRQGPDNYDSFNARAKIDIKIKPWLKLSSNTKFFRDKYFYHNNDFHGVYLHAISSLVPVNPDGTAVFKNVVMKNNGIMNGLSADFHKGKRWNRDKTTEFTTSWALTADITKNFKFVADFSYKFGYLRNENRVTNVQYSTYPGEILTESSSYPDRLQEVVYEQNNYVANGFFAYDNTWKGIHHFAATAGVNYEARRYKDLKVRRTGLLTEELTDFNLAKGNIDKLEGGVSEYALAGLFYRFTYDYKSRYLIEMNGRYDGSSRFLEGHRWGFFPSVSAAWRISEEPWMAGVKDVVNNLKLRVSYGSLGNQNIGYYDYYQGVNTNGKLSYSLNGSSQADYAYVDAPTSTGTWESIETKNVGIDLGLWQDRLTFTGNAYIRDTKGILTRGRPLPSIYGASEPKVNANDLRNVGWELQIQYKNSFNIGSHRLDYSVGASLADYTAWYTRCDNPSGLIDEPYVGKKYGEIWGYRIDGLFDNDREAAEYAAEVDMSTIKRHDYGATGPNSSGVRGGDMIYLDLNNDKTINGGAGTLTDHGDMEIIGNSTPRYSYSFNGGFNFFGFDFYIFFQGIGRQDLYPAADQEANPLFWGSYGRPYISFIPKDFMQNVWTEDNKDAYFPRVMGYTAHNGSLTNVNDRYLQNLAYLRLKNLTVGYTLPDKWMSKVGISRLRVYFSGENLWYASPLKKINRYIDPEVLRMGGSSGEAYSMCKTFSFGLTLEF